MTTIPNWAPLSHLDVKPKVNDWSLRHGLNEHCVFMYTGTLAMKHNPALLLMLAKHFRHEPRVRVVVVSEGRGAAWLQEQAREELLSNILVLPFQAHASFPEVVGTADVLVGILERDASMFSVPSKVSTYLCANRAILLALPTENQAARIVQQCEGGLVADCGDTDQFLQHATRLFYDKAFRGKLADNGRLYATTHYGIGQLTDRFERVLRPHSVVVSPMPVGHSGSSRLPETMIASSGS
jgi:hypothetical protein